MAVAVHACPLLICLAALPLAAETIDPVNDLRIGATAMRLPRVEERISGPTGSNTYDWKNDAALGGVGVRYEIGWWHANRLTPGSGWTGEWMVGASFANFDITPDSYDIGSLNVENRRQDLELDYRQYGLALGYGLATLPTDTEVGDLHWELMPVLRGGFATAETTTTGAEPEIRERRSPWWEAGIEGALVLSEHGWVCELHGGFAYGRFTTTFDLPHGQESDMTITTLAPQLGLRIGGRF